MFAKGPFLNCLDIGIKLILMMNFALFLSTIPSFCTDFVFKYEIIDSHTDSKQNDFIVIGDINRDGYPDIVIGGKKGNPTVMWYENRKGLRWKKHKIGSVKQLEAGGVLFDIDKDGDLDLIIGQTLSGNNLYWFECPENPKKPWESHLITSLFSKYHDQVVGDIDQDGKDDLVSSSQINEKLCWVPIPQNPKVTPWPSIHEIASYKSEGIELVDLDLDGDNDIVFGSSWFENRGNSFNSWLRHKVSDFENPRVKVGDLDWDGNYEIVMVEGEKPDAKLAWFDRTDTWNEILLGTNLHYPHTLEVQDFDNDGDLDILTAEMNPAKENYKPKIILFLNAGDATFHKTIIQEGIGTHETKSVDIDLDGDLDLIIKPYRSSQEIGLLRNNSNLKKKVCGFDKVIIDRQKPWRTIFIYAEDIDSDGWPDLATGKWWYKNPKNRFKVWERIPIGKKMNNLAVVADLDQDGKIDVLGTGGIGSKTNTEIYFDKNVMMGRKWQEKKLFKLENGDFLQGVVCKDFFRDGSEDLIFSWHNRCNQVIMVNIKSNNLQEYELFPISYSSQNEDLSSGDIDGDGDLDLILGTVALFNEGRAKFLWKQQWIGDCSIIPDRNLLCDIDLDGDLDVVLGEEAVSKPGKVLWLENVNTRKNLWREHLIGYVIGPMSLDCGDIDNDGDLDLVVGEHNPLNQKDSNLWAIQNHNGGEKWSFHLIDSGIEHHDGAKLCDIDHDGDLDIYSISWSQPELVVLYVNKASRHGDRDLLTYCFDMSIEQESPSFCQINYELKSKARVQQIYVEQYLQDGYFSVIKKIKPCSDEKTPIKIRYKDLTHEGDSKYYYLRLKGVSKTSSLSSDLKKILFRAPFFLTAKVMASSNPVVMIESDSSRTIHLLLFEKNSDHPLCKTEIFLRKGSNMLKLNKLLETIQHDDLFLIQLYDGQYQLTEKILILD